MMISVLREGIRGLFPQPVCQVNADAGAAVTTDVVHDVHVQGSLGGGREAHAQ